MALFGLTSTKKPDPESTSAPGASGAVIFDVTTARFEEAILKASLQKPVLVDFWAPWCGPCKQMMPVLEAEVTAAKGDVLLAKVNIDENPELAQAMRIQSVPTVMAFFQGQPVTGFAGARPASEIKNLIAQLVKLARSSMPDSIDVAAAMKQAGELLAAGQVAEAQQIYMAVLSQDETNAEAYAGLARTLMAAGALEEAEELMAQSPEPVAKSPAMTAVKTALEIAKGAGEAVRKLKPLQDKVNAAPEDHQARFDLAAAQFASGQKEAAIDNLLHIIARDRGWNDEAARLELLRFFEAMGFADPLSAEGRKKLSRLLFS
jgi:putative thioredoxin